MTEKTTVEMTAGNTNQPVSDEAQSLIDDAMEQAGDSPEQIAENEEMEAAGPQIPTAELLAPVVGLLCAVVVPAWEVSQPEQTALCETYAAVIDKYFPDGLNVGVEMAALTMTAAIVMPRMGKPMKYIEAESEQEEGDNGEA